MSAPSGLEADLVTIAGREHVEADVPLTDASGLKGTAAVLVRPADTAEVARVVGWAYERDVAIVPVGGRSGYSGGIVPVGDAPSLAVALDRLDGVRSLDPLRWRMEVDAGVSTATVARRARESGLRFPPDPGAPEQSQIGGNIATNAGGPHAFRYGVTGRWVTGLEVVLAPGEVARFGGPVRKDVAGYDLRSLLIGSEGTLGIVTGAWLALTPQSPVALPVAAAYATVREGCEAIDAVLGSGVVPAALEFLEGLTLAEAPPPFLPGARTAAMVVIAEAESEADLAELTAALGDGAVTHDPREVWRWREGVSLVMRGVRGQKLSEDIAVPTERLAEAIEGTLAIGAAHDVPACSWGHAGDGNVHATFLFDPGDPAQRVRVDAAAQDLFALARRLGGTASGEHGIGLLKRGQLSRQWTPAAVAAHRAVKAALDPKGLFNPGKKEA